MTIAAEAQHSVQVPIAILRQFTVSTFVVQAGRILLLWHRKLGMWLPPGGHIEPNELPDAAALRETLEETGLDVRLLPEERLAVPGPTPLARQEGIQLACVAPGHEHIDLIYFAVPSGGLAITLNPREASQVGWYALSDLAAMGVTEEVRDWAERAVTTVERRLRGTPPDPCPRRP